MRTLPPPDAMLSDGLRLWLTWRHTVNRAFLRSLPLSILALFFFISTVVVGVFSSYIVNGDDVIVLVSSPCCGQIDIVGPDAPQESVEWDALYSRSASIIAEQSERYTRDCYGNQTGPTEACTKYVRPTPPYEQQRTTCPFEDTMCKNITWPGLRIDIGPVDLNDYFGLNLPDRHRTKLRRTTSCAIIEPDGHYDIISKLNASKTRIEGIMGREIYTEEEVRRYLFGETPAGEWTMGISYMPIDLSRRMEAAYVMMSSG